MYLKPLAVSVGDDEDPRTMGTWYFSHSSLWVKAFPLRTPSTSATHLSSVMSLAAEMRAISGLLSVSANISLILAPPRDFMPPSSFILLAYHSIIGLLSIPMCAAVPESGQGQPILTSSTVGLAASSSSALILSSIPAIFSPYSPRTSPRSPTVLTSSNSAEVSSSIFPLSSDSADTSLSIFPLKLVI